MQEQAAFLSDCKSARRKLRSPHFAHRPSLSLRRSVSASVPVIDARTRRVSLLDVAPHHDRGTMDVAFRRARAPNRRLMARVCRDNERNRCCYRGRLLANGDTVIANIHTTLVPQPHAGGTLTGGRRAWGGGGGGRGSVTSRGQTPPSEGLREKWRTTWRARGLKIVPVCPL